MARGRPLRVFPTARRYLQSLINPAGPIRRPPSRSDPLIPAVRDRIRWPRRDDSAGGGWWLTGAIGCNALSVKKLPRQYRWEADAKSRPLSAASGDLRSLTNNPAGKGTAARRGPEIEARHITIERSVALGGRDPDGQRSGPLPLLRAVSVEEIASIQL